MPEAKAPGRFGRRTSATVAGLAIGAGLAAVAPQTWITWNISELGTTVTVTGAQASSAVQALGLALLALAAALTLTGRRGARVLAAVQLLLAAGALWAIIGVLRDPLTASIGQIGESTGIAGVQTWAGYGITPVLHWWLWAALALASLSAVHAVWLAIVSARWPQPTRRFQQRAPLSSRSAVDASEPAQLWDAISAGADPTRPDFPATASGPDGADGGARPGTNG